MNNNISDNDKSSSKREERFPHETFIEISSLDGDNRLVIYKTNTESPRELAADPINRYLYLIDAEQFPRIWHANFDATSKKSIVSTELFKPRDLVVDMSNHDVYWCDSQGDNIMRVNASSKVWTVWKGTPNTYDMAILGDDLYWVDRNLKRVYRGSKYNKGDLDGPAPASIKSDIEKLRDIVMHDSRNQPLGSSPCVKNSSYSDSSRSVCDQLCFAFSNSEREKCACALGKLDQDGRTCVQPEEYLLITTRREIRSFSLEKSQDSPFYPHVNLSNVVGLDYDHENKKIFFSQIGPEPMIASIDIDQSSLKSGIAGKPNVILKQGINLEGIAYDWVSKKIYWTDSSNKSIYAMNSDGSQVVDIVHVDRPRALVLDPSAGYLYYTDWGRLGNSGRIFRVTVGGDQKTPIINSSLTQPSGLAIDYAERRLYWSDASREKIERSDLDGNNRQILVSATIYPFALSVNGNFIYWTDLQLHGVYQAEKDTGSNMIEVVKRLDESPRDEHIFTSQKHMCSKSPCDINNGGCAHSCHPGPDNRAECKCEGRFKVANEGKMCVPENDGDCGYGDASDEEDCQYPACEKGEFTCDNQKSISQSQVCNGVNECKDNRTSDENHDLCPNNKTCPSSMFKCPYTNICVEDFWLCDSDNDCGFAGPRNISADEDPQMCATRKCPANSFKCPNNRCIPGQCFCDGDNDCGYGSDEPEAVCKSETKFSNRRNFSEQTTATTTGRTSTRSQRRAKAQTGANKTPAPPPPPRAHIVSSEKVEPEHLQQSNSYAKISDQSKRESDSEDRRNKSCTTEQFTNLINLNSYNNMKKCHHLHRTSRCLHKWAPPSSESSSWTSSWLRPITASGPLYALLLVCILMQACDSQFIGTNNNGADLEAPPLVGANEVAYVDLRVKDNSIQHHTILYEQIDHINPLNPTGPSMVLRRGELFNIIIHLRHTYNKQTDKIRLEFSFGQRPQVGKGTLIYLPITKDRDTFGRDPSKWDARVVRVDGNQLSVQINLPANIAVGVWRFRVSTKLAGSRTIRTYTCKEALYMIFNAWSKDDAVYLSREDARQEYVLNDVGKIYIGSHAKPRGRKWIYGQFQESVLPAVMFMLDKTRLDIVGRSSVVKVARAVSAMVNSHDDNGLLVGNWSGNYGDGLAPWQWTGSATILEKYLQSGGEPVKFGQCWVFAGVTTTALRTLGIPARTVSNFVSAHDTDDSLTVDKFFSEKGDPISDVNSDSIWNFHVWSDAWMARNDLPPGYGGWQAVDATPQETSMGMYQMGPASLEAIKKGEVGFAYDAAFVFAEVNADIVHWQQDDKSELQWKKIKTLKFHIGRKIFTKMIGQLDDYTANGVADAEDIISQYKNKEGTEDERMSVLNAARCGGLGFLFEQPAPGKEDVEFELFDIDKVQLGEPFLITVRIANKSPMRRTISLALSASSVYYTGILAQKVKRDRQNIVLNGLQEQQVRIRVNPDDYMERLVDYSMMKVYAIATVKETQQTWSKEDDFMIDKALLAGSS